MFNPKTIEIIAWYATQKDVAIQWIHLNTGEFILAWDSRTMNMFTSRFGTEGVRYIAFGADGSFVKPNDAIGMGKRISDVVTGGREFGQVIKFSALPSAVLETLVGLSAGTIQPSFFIVPFIIQELNPMNDYNLKEPL